MRLRRFTIAAGLAAVCIVLAIVTYATTRPGPGAKVYRRPPTLVVATAYTTGGVPPHDLAIEQVLGDDLTALITASEHARDAATIKDRDARLAAMRASPAFAAHGPALAKAWTDLLDALARWIATPVDDPMFVVASDVLRGSTGPVNDQLAGAGLGYWIHAQSFVSDDRGHVLVAAYRVERVDFVDAGDRSQRVLDLRRLDKLGVQRSLFGMQSEELGYPVILLDQIEDHVAGTVWDVLGANRPFHLDLAGWWATGPGGKLAGPAGAAVRAELSAALGADAAAAARIGALSAERTDLIGDWMTRFPRDHRTSAVDPSFLPDATLATLRKQLSTQDMERLETIEGAMAQLGAARIASRLADLYAASVRRHEAQHSLDARREPPLRYPQRVAELAGPLLDDAGEDRRIAVATSSELSAYLSQIASDPVAPQLGLWELSTFAFDPGGSGHAEAFVAEIAIEGLARHLGIPDPHAGDPAPATADRAIDRSRLVALGVALAGRTDDELRNAAAALWAEAYGEPYVPVVDRR